MSEVSASRVETLTSLLQPPLERGHLLVKDLHGFCQVHHSGWFFNAVNKINEPAQKDIEELIVPFVDVRRGFGALSHLRNDEIKGPSDIGLAG
jgi:hypothetical protein